MSKKKQPKNGFYYFMLDMQQAFREQGRDVSMRDMPIFAGPSWSKLSDAQKQRYSQRAKEERELVRGVPSGVMLPTTVVRSQISGSPADIAKTGKKETGRKDCTGNLVSELKNMETVIMERTSEECLQIQRMFPAGRRVAVESFFFIDIQSVCCIPNKPEQKYLPCEVALVKYSLSEGVHTKLHCFIKPGPVPIGYRFLAQSTSDLTHQIPVEGGPSAVRDYRMLLGSLESFLLVNRSTIPPVFAKRASVERVMWSLQWLAESAGVINRISQVYEVENLIGELAAHANSPKSRFAIEDLLKTSNYDHDTCTRCDYHEERECTHCSLGICHTYCYTMSELLCSLYGVSITRSHLPIIPQATAISNPSERARRASDTSYSYGSPVTSDTVPKGLGRGIGRGRGRAAYNQPPSRGIGRGQNVS